jgi:hypothetical protein
MAEARFELCSLIAVAETGLSVSRWVGVGATRPRLGLKEGPQACPFGRRVSDSAVWRPGARTAGSSAD